MQTAGHPSDQRLPDKHSTVRSTTRTPHYTITTESDHGV